MGENLVVNFQSNLITRRGTHKPEPPYSMNKQFFVDEYNYVCIGIHINFLFVELSMETHLKEITMHFYRIARFASFTH